MKSDKVVQFTIQVRNNEIKQVVRSYAEVIRFDIDKNKRMEGGKELALFNSIGLLELAIYKSNPTILEVLLAYLACNILTSFLCTSNSVDKLVSIF